jgi:transposase-like protein
MFAGLRKPAELIVIVVTLLAYGCPLQAIVHAFGLDERTVATWRDRAGRQCEKVHQDKVEKENIDLEHVQADEIRVKGKGNVLWMALAIMVPTRLWLAGTVDSKLTDRLMQQVSRCCKILSQLLVCTDGFGAYPKSIRRAFRVKVKKTTGRGRCRLEVWKDLHIGTVIKCTVKMHLKEILRVMSHGCEEQALKILQSSKGGTMLNTSFIERLNGTMRERLAALTRKCRHTTVSTHTFHTGMYLVGCTYNFCWPHHELSKPLSKGGVGMPCTPAMATGLTDHIWSMVELLSYKIAPPPLPTPKKRGRPRTKSVPDPSVPKRPRGRPRKEVVCSSTS